MQILPDLATACEAYPNGGSIGRSRQKSTAGAGTSYRLGCARVESTPQGDRRPTAVLVAVQHPSVTDEEMAAELAELGRLVQTLGLEVIGQVVQKRGHLRAGTALGLGKLQELARMTGGTGKVEPHVPGRKKKDAEEEEDEEPESLRPEEGAAEEPPARKAEVVVVDHELSPRVQRNLERATDAEVLDRSHVIVEIFHRHAKSREARLQVEIARLAYVVPRLREAGAGKDRQRGGIGGKGAGESSLELDRRRVRDRIAELRRELAKIENEQDVRRAGRRQARRVALVGYTNAGKSSLMRALTGSGVYVADKLFATLDTTVRALKPETEPRILVSDTVGFIKKLPHQLVASFRSTLDEAREASHLLYVADASDPTFRGQLETTRTVLREIGAGDIPSRLLLNKCDRLDAATRAALAREIPDAMLVSALDPRSVAEVRDAIITFFEGELVQEELFVPYSAHQHVRHVYENATVLDERHDERGTHLKVRATTATLARLRERVSASP
jgi:GTPase